MIEIERKFLVKGDFLSKAVEKIEIKQGYLCALPERTVRIRLKSGKAFLTLKGPSDQNGFSRLELEYEIPYKEGLEIMSLCPDPILKERYLIPYKDHVFEVDVFHGRHEGLIIAELELKSENETFEKPSWLGKEVTGDMRYYNAYLSNNI